MKRPRTGFLIMDGLTAIAIVLTVAGVLAVAMNRQSIQAQKLADSRAAVRLAEDVAASLQSPTPPPAESSSNIVWVQPLSDPSPLASNTWVQIEARCRESSAKITTLVRRDALARWIATHPREAP